MTNTPRPASWYSDSELVEVRARAASELLRAAIERDLRAPSGGLPSGGLPSGGLPSGAVLLVYTVRVTEAGAVTVYEGCPRCGDVLDRISRTGA